MQKLNNKGIAPLLLIAGAAAIVILIVGLFAGLGTLFSTKIRWIVVGVLVLAAGLYILGKAMMSEGEITKNKMIIFLVFLGVGLFFIFGAGLLQTAITGIEGINTNTYTKTVITCFVVQDCSSYLSNHGVSQENINKVDFKCENNFCLAKIKS